MQSLMSGFLLLVYVLTSSKEHQTCVCNIPVIRLVFNKGSRNNDTVISERNRSQQYLAPVRPRIPKRYIY